MTPDERAELLDALLDGTISEADLLRIEAELTVDSEVRREYYRRIQLEMLLESEYSENPSDEQTSSTSLQPEHLLREARSNTAGRAFSLLAGMMVGVAACVPFLFVLRQNPEDGNSVVVRNSAESPEADTARGFGVLVGASDVAWEGRGVKAGELLPPGALHLNQGRIHIELFSGVQLMIEGDAKFSVDSPMLVTLQSGRARAHVPEPAQGFRLKTNTGEVVDLGTEFSVAVDDTGADVKVLDGEVELQSRNSPAQRIQEGSSLRLSNAGITPSLNGGGENLPSPLEFQSSLEAKVATKIEAWNAVANGLKADERFIGYYHFAPEDIRARLLGNRVANAFPRASDGAIVAGERAADRWGRSGSALDFSRMGSRVRVSIPGEHRGLSMFCWVKINSLDRMFNSLFLTDGHEDNEPHWQIQDDGRLFFSVKVPQDSGKPIHHKYLSPKIWDKSLSGKWIMLGVTYDVDARQVTHFLNGRPVSVEAIPEGALCEKAQIGAASICNWSEPMYRTDATFVVRNLNGSMDEFAICEGSLSETEILEIYEAGNPNEH